MSYQAAQQEQELIQTEKMAIIGQLSAGIAHELNNPLGSILGFAQLLSEEIPPDDPKQTDLKKIEAAALRCKKTIESLLEFSRPAKSKFERIGLNQIIEEALFLFEQEIKSRSDIKIFRRLPKSLLTILGNANQLEQVFLNLLSNAKNALPEGGDIRVSARLNQKEKTIEIKFKDNGLGISEKSLPKIFEPFFTLKRSPESSGLGLAICKTILERHKGSIEVKSKLKKGTTFTIRLPV